MSLEEGGDPVSPPHRGHHLLHCAGPTEGCWEALCGARRVSSTGSQEGALVSRGLQYCFLQTLLSSSSKILCLTLDGSVSNLWSCAHPSPPGVPGLAPCYLAQPFLYPLDSKSGKKPDANQDTSVPVHRPTRVLGEGKNQNLRQTPV